MLQSHSYRILHNKLSLVCLLLIFFIPCVEIIQLLMTQIQFGDKWDPAFAFFLTGSSRAHGAQIVLIWFLPIYFLIAFSDDAVLDYKLGYRNVVVNKIGIKKYCAEKILGSFLFSFVTMLCSLLLNMILTKIIFNHGTYDKGISDFVGSSHSLLHYELAHPYITLVFFTLIFSIYAGLAGALGASFSLLFKDKKYAYAATFFVWFMLILRNQSLVFIFQPFTEYNNLHTSLPILFTTLAVLVVIPIIVFIVEVKFHEV
ncbi:UNVERIFIED_ORG: magnesium-transporting ATPase (P-type) [Heyndrickxia coagulans]